MGLMTSAAWRKISSNAVKERWEKEWRILSCDHNENTGNVGCWKKEESKGKWKDRKMYRLRRRMRRYAVEKKEKTEKRGKRMIM